MNHPKVSIIIPAYNAGRYIHETLTSLIAQTYSNWEAIIIDDGSTDNTLEVISQFKDLRISFVSQKNNGVKKLAKTINVGLELATGELVTMLPADDLWPPERLERQIPYFSNPDIVLVHGKMKLINADSTIIGEAKTYMSKLWRNPSRFETLMELISRNSIFQPTVLIRRNTLLKIGGYIQERYMYAEDYPTQLELAMHGRFKYIPEILAFYRIHSGQMTMQHQYKMIASDRVFVRRFLSKNKTDIAQLPGYKEIKVLEAKKLRNAFDYYKLGKYFVVQAGSFKKALTLSLKIIYETKSVGLSLRLLAVITISIVKKFSLRL